MDNRLMEIHFKNILSSMDKLDNHVSKLFEKQEMMHVCLTETRAIIDNQTPVNTKLSEAIDKHSDIITGVLAKTQNLDFSTRNMLSEVHALKSDVKILNSTKSKLDIIPRGLQLFGTLIGVITSIFGTYFIYLQVFLK